MPQPGRGQVEGGLAVGEGPHDAGTAPDFSHDALKRVVGLQLDPVLIGESVEAEGLRDVGLDQLGRPGELLGFERGNHLGSLPRCRRAALLGMDGFQHMGDLTDLGRGHVAENVAVEVHHAALPPCRGVEVRSALDQAQTGVRDDQFDAGEAALFEVTQKGAPARLVLLGALHDPQDLAEALLVHADRHQQRDIAHLTGPAALEHDPVEIDIRVCALDRLVAPDLDLLVDLLVQVRNGPGAHPRAP